jgi:hypothetical protein
MDSRTGDLYPTKQAALDAGVPERYLVELAGPEPAIRTVVRKVRMVSRHENARRKARRNQAKASRRANRG